MSRRLLSVMLEPGGVVAVRRAWGGVGLALVVMLSGCNQGQAPNTSGPSVATASTPSASVAPEPEDSLDAEALKRVANTRVLFGHRSVGASIAEQGIPAVYATQGLPSPVFSEESPNGTFRDEWLTQTEDPVDKIEDFDDWFRLRGLGDGVDVALMKLGYLDVGASTDTQALFDEYVNLMDALERDYPSTRFLHSTITVTQWDPEASAAIERFNASMRSKYADTGQLVDLAQVLSDCPGTGRATKTTESGAPYYTLCDQYSADGGHPNELGATVAAAELLGGVARASQDLSQEGP